MVRRRPGERVLRRFVHQLDSLRLGSGRDTAATFSFSAFTTLFMVSCTSSGGSLSLSSVRRRPEPRAQLRIANRFETGTLLRTPSVRLLEWPENMLHACETFLSLRKALGPGGPGPSATLKEAGGPGFEPAPASVSERARVAASFSRPTGCPSPPSPGNWR